MLYKENHTYLFLLCNNRHLERTLELQDQAFINARDSCQSVIWPVNIWLIVAFFPYNVSFTIWNRMAAVVFSEQCGGFFFSWYQTMYGLTLCYVLFLLLLITFLFSCFITISLYCLHVSLEVLSQNSLEMRCVPSCWVSNLGLLGHFSKLTVL